MATAVSTQHQTTFTLERFPGSTPEMIDVATKIVDSLTKDKLTGLDETAFKQTYITTFLNSFIAYSTLRKRPPIPEVKANIQQLRERLDVNVMNSYARLSGSPKHVVL